jgi:hypothetical protein
MLSTANAPIDSSLSTFNINDLPQQSLLNSQLQLTGKRKLTELSDPSLPPVERARLEADEDKRRRNTAASARFRVKKKQREQALDKTAKEMTEKVAKLQKKVAELEMENKWLKGLITERKPGGESIVDMWEDFKSKRAERRVGRKEEDES